MPPGAQAALLRSPGGSFVPPRSELGLSGPRLPGAPPILPAEPFSVLHAADAVGAYPLRGLVWASVLPQQAYRGRTLQRAQNILGLLDALRGSSGRGFAGLPPTTWNPVRLRSGHAVVTPSPTP